MKKPPASSQKQLFHEEDGFHERRLDDGDESVAFAESDIDEYCKVMVY